MSPLGLARVARRPHDDPLDVAQTPLRVAVVRVCKEKKERKGKYLCRKTTDSIIVGQEENIVTGHPLIGQAGFSDTVNGVIKYFFTSDEDHGSVGQHSHAGISRPSPMQALGITKSLLQEGREGPIRSQAYFLGGDRSSGAQEVTARRRRRRRSAKAARARRLRPFRPPAFFGRAIQHPRAPQT